MYKFHFSPDITGASASVPSVTDTHVRHHATVPAKLADLLNVAGQVSEAWLANPAFSLIWKTQADFAIEIAACTAESEGRNTVGGTRQQQTQELENIDHEIEDAVPFIKSYVNNKYGPRNGPAYYASFGITHDRKQGYELPENRQLRVAALKMMQDGVAAEGFGTNQYGTAFWASIASRYNKALALSSGKAGDISEHVSELTKYRTSIRRVLHSILLLLEANYPDAFDQMRRKWGFQKESY